MAFWLLDKRENKPRIFGGISVMCKNTDLKPDRLYTHFGRDNKNIEFENENYRIAKLEVERGGKESE